MDEETLSEARRYIDSIVEINARHGMGGPPSAETYERAVRSAAKGTWRLKEAVRLSEVTTRLLESAEEERCRQVMRERYPNLTCDECGVSVEPILTGGWPFCSEHWPSDDEPKP